MTRPSDYERDLSLVNEINGERIPSINLKISLANRESERTNLQSSRQQWKSASLLGWSIIAGFIARELFVHIY